MRLVRRLMTQGERPERYRWRLPRIGWGNDPTRLAVIAVALLLTRCTQASPVPASAVVRVYALDVGRAKPAVGSGLFIGTNQFLTTRHVIGRGTPLGIATHQTGVVRSSRQRPSLGGRCAAWEGDDSVGAIADALHSS